MPLGRVIRPSLSLIALAFLFVAAALLHPVHAADRTALAFDQPAQSTAAPTIQVYSRETVVDVTVTDKDGNSVHGLQQKDFTLMEDGKLQAIKSFEEFGARTAAAAPAQPKLPPNVYTNLQPPPTSSALNIILLDFVNTAPELAIDCCQIAPCLPGLNCNSPTAGSTEVARAIAAQQRVKADAIQYIQHMPAGTRVEVVGMWWPGTLRVLQGFTSDPALLTAAVNTMNYDTNSTVAAGSPDPLYIAAVATRDPRLRIEALNKPDSASDDASNALIGAGTLYEQICQQADGRDRMTLEALQQIATDLIGIKGKKNLLWFTKGTPYITDPNSRPRCLPDYSADLTRTYSLLLAGQAALYPIDANGITVLPDNLLELSGKLMLNIGSLSGSEHANAEQEFVRKIAADHFSMEDWAEKTGGEAFYNTNDLEGALAKAIDEGANYYTLSYVPPGTKYDGQYHKIKVSVNVSGLHLVYRNGYAAEDPSTFKPAPGLTLATTSAPDPASPIDMRSEMARAMPTSQQLLFDVQVEPSSVPAKPTDPAVFGMLNVKLKDKPLARYGFSYALPGRQIALKAADDGKQHGSLEFDLAAYDADGNVVTSLRQAIDLNLTADQAAQLAHSPFRYFQQLDLPPGALFLRVGILDRTANKVGTLEIPLTVAKPAQPVASAPPR